MCALILTRNPPPHPPGPHHYRGYSRPMTLLDKIMVISFIILFIVLIIVGIVFGSKQQKNISTPTPQASAPEPVPEPVSETYRRKPAPTRYGRV